MNEYDKWKEKAEKEFKKYDKWIKEWKKKTGIGWVLDFENNFLFNYCGNCKFNKGHYSQVICLKAKEEYVTLEGLLFQVLDRPYGKCKFFEPKEVAKT